MTVEEMVVAYQQGQLSFEELYPFIEKLVYREANKWKIKGMEKDDIVSELMLALYEACEKFDMEKGYKFSTFAVSHLRYRIREEWRKTKLAKYGSEWTICSADGVLGVKSRRIYEAGFMKVHQDADELVKEQALIKLIQEACQQLTTDEQSYVMDYLFNDLTMKEIADKYNTYPQYINNRLKRSLEKIQWDLYKNHWEICL